MYSPNKQQDRELLLELVEVIEVLIKVGVKTDKKEAFDLAESLGDDYLSLQEKIKTFDYSREDELEKSIQKYL
jgi:recombinational DNA repair protein RecR